MAAVTIQRLIESGLSTDTVLVKIMNYFSRALMGHFPLLPWDGDLTKDQCRTVFQLRQNRKRDEQQNLKIKKQHILDVWVYGGEGSHGFCFQLFILFIYHFWLHWVFVALRRLSRIVESRLFTAVASLVVECRLSGTRVLEVAVCGLQ